jgi:DNA-binding FrmR family transcriptional regulator
MIESEEYCTNDITLTFARRKSLSSLNKRIIENHLKHMFGASST